NFSSLSLVCNARRSFNGEQETPEGFPAVANNFVKGASFSPDGTCLLTSSDDTVLRVFEVPRGALQPAPEGEPEGRESSAASLASSATEEDWSPCLGSVEGETVYDFAWYPYMSSIEPATSVFVSTSRDHPLHMWDAFTGKLRATYRAYDHLDEVVAANSVSFNTFGTKIFAGKYDSSYNRMIRVFDVAQPGRSFEARPTCKTRKSKVGQRGIISSLAFSPDSFGGGLFAAGSYAKTICLYSENRQVAAIRGRAVAELATPTIGGITHLMFAPDGISLFSGSRKDSDIVCWDIRQTGEVIYTPVRQADTNQRIMFDIDPSGRYLATGSTDNMALVYDIAKKEQICSLENQPDAVGSVCFHPFAALLGVCTGQRHFHLDTVAGSDSSDDDQSEDTAPESSPWRNGVTLYNFGQLSTR
ncbi:unnamed protein product, partial [Ascophyllum nodosum]